MVFLSVSLKDFFCYPPPNTTGIALESILTVAGVNESKSSFLQNYILFYYILSTIMIYMKNYALLIS